jgi:hypothetical protein
MITGELPDIGVGSVKVVVLHCVGLDIGAVQMAFVKTGVDPVWPPIK